MPRPTARPEAAILITGFEPFGGEAINPSWEVARSLNGQTINGWPVVAHIGPRVTFKDGDPNKYKPDPPALRAEVVRQVAALAQPSYNSGRIPAQIRRCKQPDFISKLERRGQRLTMHAETDGRRARLE